jgi:hypothetical protein
MTIKLKPTLFTKIIKKGEAKIFSKINRNKHHKINSKKKKKNIRKTIIPASSIVKLLTL